MLWCILFCGWYDRIKMKYWRSFIEIKAAGDWQKRKSIISACARLSLHTGDLITHLTTTTTTDNSPNPQPLVLLSHKVYQGNAAMWPFFMFFCEKKKIFFVKRLEIFFSGFTVYSLFYFIDLWPPDFAALLFPSLRRIASATHRQLTRFPTLELHWTSEWDQPGPYQMPGLWSR